MFVDISAHNGEINFKELATTGVDMIFIRSSLGYGDVDKNLSKNATAASESRTPVSYYHFAYPHDNTQNVSEDAMKQANWFCDTIANLPAPTHLAVDLENFSVNKDTGLSQNDYAKWLKSFLDTVESRTSKRCVIYSYADYLNRHLPDDHALATYDLWIANYGTHTKTPPLPKGWIKYWAWQYSETGEIPGIEGHVDLSKTA